MWDISFGTARFRDNTIETGDAGAEPALVNGSWGAQQLAGFRRMNQVLEREDTPSIRGMVHKVRHLVAVNGEPADSPAGVAARDRR